MGYAIMFSSLVMSALTLLFSFSPVPFVCALACAAMYFLSGAWYLPGNHAAGGYSRAETNRNHGCKNAILTPWSGVTYSIMGLVADAAGAKIAFIAAAALYIMTFLIALAQPRLIHYRRENRVQWETLSKWTEQLAPFCWKKWNHGGSSHVFIDVRLFKQEEMGYI